MNILFVIDKLIYGGSERYVNMLSDALVEKGYGVVIMSSGGPIVSELNKKVIHKKVTSIAGTSKADMTKTANYIEKLCQEYKIDLIHCNSVTSFRAVKLVRKSLRLPVIYTAHATEQSKIPVVGAELDLKVDKVIAVSSFIKSHLRKTGLLSRKINLVYHGVDIGKFKEKDLDTRLKSSLGIKDKERVIMCVARLKPEKGIGELIKAIPIILEKGNNIKVVFVGDGAFKKEYEKLAKDLGVKEKVIFTGAKGNVEDYLSIADVFCLSSVREALSLAILEAMAEGKPVVATRVGGVPEAVIDKVNGLLVPPGNTRWMASAINRLLEDNRFARRLGSNAKSRVKQDFRFDRMLNETLDTFHEVMEGQEVFA